MNMEQAEIRALARGLLESKRVEVVLGYARGPDVLTAIPLFATRPEQADALVFDATCEYNLANYLHRFKDRRAAIVVKGCDERSVIGLIQEKQVVRENLVIIGAPCEGILDARILANLTGGESVSDASWSGGSLDVRLRSGRAMALKKDEVLHAMCSVCPVRNPRFADYAIAGPVPQPAVPDFAPDMENLSAASANKRWATFRREMSKCTLCFACRNLCPACYCASCFTESSQPKWMSKTDDPSDAMFFHLTRLLHLTGRCTGCGACERACPVNVKLHLYNDKVRKDVKDVFGFVAGTDPAATPPMASFKIDDKNDFIR